MTWEYMADEALMVCFRDGEAAAFDVLYARHKAPLFRYFRRQCATAETAQDMFQDVWMNIIRSRERYQSKAKFATYLYRVAHNRLVDHYRANTRTTAIMDNLDDLEDAEPAAASSVEPDRRVDSERQLARLHELIAGLPDEQRDAFLLHEDGGLSIDEIAAITGVERETAKSRLRYAMRKLRRDLGWES